MIAVLVNIGFYGLIFVLSLYFQRTEGRSPLESGLFFAPMTAVVLATNLLSSPLSRRYGARAVLVAATLAAAAGYAGLLFAGPATPFYKIVAQMVVVGVALYGALVTLRPHVAVGLAVVLGCSIGTACAAAAVAGTARRQPQRAWRRRVQRAPRHV